MAELDERVVRIETKIDKVMEHVSEINVTLAKQHVSLDDHIRRTAILETQIIPLKKQSDMAYGIIKFIALVAAVSGGVEGVVAVLQYLGHR